MSAAVHGGSISSQIAPDHAQIKRALTALHGPDDIIELRAIHKGRKRVDAGYFDGKHREQLINEAMRLNSSGAAVYVTMNKLDPQLHARHANRVQEFAQATATDANVTRRHWLLIDIDPQRPKDTSATDEQLALATERAQAVHDFLSSCGWPKPASADSGNGLHFLYRVDLPNDEDSRDLIKNCLGALDKRFSDKRTKIDQSVFNAARIVKLHGTIANKGDNVPAAPWRLSKLRTVPAELLPVPVDLLRALAAEVAQVEKIPRSSTGGVRAWSERDVQSFLTRGGIEAVGPDQHEGVSRWKLKQCPFNPDHGFGEAAVFLRPDGRLGFECRHDSCQDKHWRDLRTLVDGERTQHKPALIREHSQDSQHSRGVTAGNDGQHAVVSEPEPLRRPLPPAESYPIEALGDVLGAAARRICDVLCVPTAMAGQSILAAASVAIQSHADIDIDGRRELLSLWHLTIGVSGERKSACDQLALRAHREFERAALEEYTREKAIHDIEMIAYEAAAKSVSKGKDVDAIHNEISKLGGPPDGPLKPLLLVGSPTLEGIHKQLVAGLPGIGLFHDDAGEFLGGHSMSKEHRTKTAAGLSKLWDFGEFDRVRAGDGAEKYYGKRLALHLMIQPVIAETVLSDEVLTQQGFLARCLLSWPASTIGTRAYVEKNLTADPVMSRYWNRMRALLSAKPTLRPESRNELEPRSLSLTRDAKSRWIAIHDVIEADMADIGEYSSVRAWASKSPAQILRIAAVLTLAEQPDCGVISVDHIDRAAVLVTHYLSEAVRIVGVASVPKSIRDAESLLNWCHETHIDLLHSAHALQMGPSAIRSKHNFDQSIVELERCGWVVQVDGGVVIDGKHRRRVWVIRRPS